MAVFMQTMASKLLIQGRSDPEYYLPHHTQIESQLRSVNTVSMRQLGTFDCSAFYPAATHLYTQRGIPFLRCVDIVNYPIISSDQPFARIPEEFSNKHSTIRTLNAGDIVISKVGSPCFASILSDDMPTSAMTRTVFGMSSIKTEIVDPFYLLAFLRSKHGFDQLMRERELTIQYQLTLDRVRKVKVFLPNEIHQKYIGDLIRRFYQTTRECLDNYKQAQKLLESELGLDKLSFQKPVGYAALFSEAATSRRIDADYYQIPFRQIQSHLDNLQTTPLSQLVGIVKGIEVGSKAYTASGVPFLRVSNIKEKAIELGASDKYISDDLYAQLSDYQPQVGELLLTKDGTAGVCFAVDEEVNGIISGGIVRLLPRRDDIPNEYLALVINSKACRMQVEQDCSGALILHWKPSSIRKLRIPLLTKSKMQEIADLVSRSKQAKRESNKLLEQAKTRVEQLIEEAVQA